MGQDTHAFYYPTLLITKDVINEADYFEYTFVVLVYNPAKDNFVGMYSKNHISHMDSINTKLLVTMSHLAFRKLFLDRFKPDQPEMAFALGSGDYPHVLPQVRWNT